MVSVILQRQFSSTQPRKPKCTQGFAPSAVLSITLAFRHALPPECNVWVPPDDRDATGPAEACH